MGGPFNARVRWPIFALSILLATSLAGCADSTTTTAPGAGGGASETMAPTASTGAILVRVVTSELQAVEKAQVVLGGTDKALLSGPDGTAQFSELEPGAYTVVVAKPGYAAREPKGKLVNVVAGEVLEAQMGLDPQVVANAENTYHNTFPFVGFLTCTVQVYPFAAQTCGRQSVVGDPNGKSHHAFTIDTNLV